MAKTAQTKDQKKPTSEGNRYTPRDACWRGNDRIDVETLADRAYMSESTAERCLEAWNACVAALIEVGRLPDPAKATAQKKTTPKPKPAATEATGAMQATAETGRIETAPAI